MPSPHRSELDRHLAGLLALRELLASSTGGLLQPEEMPLQLPLPPASHKQPLQLPLAPASHKRQQDHGVQAPGNEGKGIKLCKIAEALDEVDAHDPATVVRVNGLRALGDAGLSIVARYFAMHFGSVKKTVPVVCQGKSGQHRRSNFGFVVMSCAAEAQQILAREALIVDRHEITVREYAATQQERVGHERAPQFQATNVAEAMVAKFEEAMVDDAHDQKTTTVRVKGLRALGHEGLCIVARYLEAFGSVRRKVPVTCPSPSGQQMPSNFGFVVLSCTAEAEQLLARATHIVDRHRITIRVLASKHKELHVRGDMQRSMDGNWPRPKDDGDWCQSRMQLGQKSPESRSDVGVLGCTMGYREGSLHPQVPAPRGGMGGPGCAAEYHRVFDLRGLQPLD